MTLRTCFFSPFSSFNDEKINWITTGDNGNVQSHDQEGNRLNSTINASSGAHTITHDKATKSLFNKDKVERRSCNNDLVTRACRTGVMVPI